MTTSAIIPNSSLESRLAFCDRESLEITIYRNVSDYLNLAEPWEVHLSKKNHTHKLETFGTGATLAAALEIAYTAYTESTTSGVTFTPRLPKPEA